MFLNQILYPNKKFDSPESLILFEPFIYKPFETGQIPELGKDVAIQSVEPVNISGPKDFKDFKDSKDLKDLKDSKDSKDFKDSKDSKDLKDSKDSKDSKNPNKISPTQTDTLFWCIYIAKYGYLDYISIGTKYKNKEIEIKQQMIKTIQTTPNLLRSEHKITKVATQEIMSELMLDQKTSLQTLYAMCVINKLCVYLVDENTKTYLKYGEDDHGPILITRSDGYHIDLDTTSDKIEKVETFFRIEHGPKPIKPISSYKMADLEKIIETLNITFESKVKKQEMYDKILNHCLWTADSVKRPRGPKGNNVKLKTV